MTSCGRYEIICPLGAGGMAEVFEGVAVSGGGITRRVAIKRLPPNRLSHASARTMFFDEARIASQLNHANVVGIIDYGEANGAPFLVMEFVDGLDAKIAQDEIGGGKVPPGLALHICTEIAYALVHAHGVCDSNGEPLGIVHRDVSPNNILLSWEGDVRLTDFGIATAFDRTSKTKTGLAKGKPPFMAPEQLLGGKVDGRTDCFSLGCTLHALLVGSSPLSADDALPNFLNEQRLRLDPEIDDEVKKIIDRATHYRKTSRYASAEEMAHALAAARARLLGSDSPRRRLTEWMLPHRESLRGAAHHTGLHELLGIAGNQSGEIAFVFDDTSESVRRFSTVVVNKAAVTEDVGERPNRWPAFLTVGAVAALGVLLAITYVPVAPNVSNAPDATVTAPADVVQPAEPPPVIPTPPAADATPADPGPRGERPRGSTQNVPPRAPTTDPTVQAQPAAPVGSPGTAPAPTPAPTTATDRLGAVTVGGAGAHLSAVFVDGRRRGSAPTTIELSHGVHRVELRRRTEGGAWEVVARRSIVLDERHSRRSPLRWIVR